MGSIKIIVGLGNPGDKYSDTRHNIGFRAVELYAQRHDMAWREWKGIAEISGDNSSKTPILVKPMLFMNRSGEPVKKICGMFGANNSEILVIMDDFSLDLGRLRLRLSGSSGGHNGLMSIIETLGSKEIPRLRLGIGPLDQGIDPADFVLSKFKKAEKGTVLKACEKTADAISSIIAHGLEKTVSKGVSA